MTTRLSEPSSTFKRALAHMEPGTVVQTSGPFGRFVYRETDTPAVFIAGGIDITPFRSIIGDLASRKIRARITLLYTNRAPDIPFRSFFEALLPDWRELQLVYTVTQPSEDWQGPTGRINAAFIKQHVGDLAHPLFFVSGSLGSNASTTTCAPHCTAWVRQVTPRRVFVWRSRWRVLMALDEAITCAKNGVRRASE